ncbi:caldesmon-like [Ambystoma mexicanum]|uniref:caldesmon-like n=1 Tax=Ambystoma mexicanum TaxID=8296 RepID=UPI0037E993A6
MAAAQKYERPPLQQGRKNSKNEKTDEVGADSDTDNSKRRLRSVKSPARRLKSKTLPSEETAHEEKKELHTPRSRYNSTNNELREVGKTTASCACEPEEKDAQVTTEPQVPQINLSGERKQDLPVKGHSALHTALKASGFQEMAAGGQPLTDPQQERCDAEDRRERREKKSSEKTTNRGAGQPALPASPDPGRAGRNPTRMGNMERSGLEKRREKVRGQTDSPDENTKGTQIAELAKSQANKLTTTQERESVEVDSLPQENEEGRRLNWPIEKVPKTGVQVSVHRKPGSVDTDEELGISENVIGEETKQREDNRTQVPINKSISNEGKESSTEESWSESETGMSDSDSETGQEKKALKAKQKKRITTNKPTTQRKKQEKTNEMKTTKNTKGRGCEQLGKTKTTLENIKKNSQKKIEGMQKGTLPVSLSGTLKAFFFNQQKRKLDLENDLSDAELLEAVEVNSGGDSQQTPGVTLGLEGPPATGLSQLLQEKKNAAKAIRRQIEEREERRKQSTFKKHQEEPSEGGGNTVTLEDDNQRQALARERVLQPKDQ